MTTTPQKITFGEMRASGARGALIWVGSISRSDKSDDRPPCRLAKSKCPSSAIIPPTLPGAATGSAGRRSAAGA